eukprot:IDg21175t1
MIGVIQSQMLHALLLIARQLRLRRKKSSTVAENLGSQCSSSQSSCADAKLEGCNDDSAAHTALYAAHGGFYACPLVGWHDS